MQKNKFDTDNKNLYLTLLVFKSGKLPDIFLYHQRLGRNLIRCSLIENMISQDKRVLQSMGLIYH
jgi:hypothetical protein